MPSKSIEAWVLAALYPDDVAMRQGIECFPNPGSRLSQQPKKMRIKKRILDYQARSDEIQNAWRAIARPGALSEALRFEESVKKAIR